MLNNFTKSFDRPKGPVILRVYETPVNIIKGKTVRHRKIEPEVSIVKWLSHVFRETKWLQGGTALDQFILAILQDIKEDFLAGDVLDQEVVKIWVPGFWTG